MAGLPTSRGSAKRSFFDRDAVIAALGKAERRFLSRAGAHVRLVARRSIRRRKSPSSPGSPPRSRTGLLKQIYFSFDPGSRSVVVGPVKLNGASGDAPRLLEEGGTAQRRLRLVRGKAGDERLITDPKARKRTVRYRPRPYMAPAHESAAARRAEFWQHALR